MLAAVRRRRLLLLPLLLRFFSAAAAASTITDPKVVSYLISSCGLTPAAAARAAATSPWLPLASPDFASNADAVLALLRRYGFTEADISATVRAFSRILASDPARTLQPKLDYLRSVGITAPLLPRVVFLNPVILHRSIESHLAPLIASLGEPQGYLLRTLPVLRDIHGLTPSELSKLVASQPGVILLGPDRAGEIVQAVKDAGVEPGSPMFVYIFAAFSKLKAPTLENKFAIYRGLGFGKDDIAVMLRRLPNAAGISEERLKRTVGFLTAKAGLRREDIVAYPNLLSRSLDSHARRCAVARRAEEGREAGGAAPRAPCACGQPRTFHEGVRGAVRGGGPRCLAGCQWRDPLRGLRAWRVGEEEATAAGEDQKWSMAMLGRAAEHENMHVSSPRRPRSGLPHGAGIGTWTDGLIVLIDSVDQRILCLVSLYAVCICYRQLNGFLNFRLLVFHILLRQKE
uniref:Uncharacterized protein n=1 Tax=Oryza meridionalis TaxID=40149 RepID=A0A0E0DRD8_9ORYZ